MTAPNAPTVSRWHQIGLAGLALLLLSTFLWYWARLQPADVFGLFYDDTVYFATARSVAQGGGFTLPNVPGAPHATKYPPLYPALLAVVWRLAPAFPANVMWAAAGTALFAIWLLGAAWVWLRRLGASPLAALGLTALCAFHPVFLVLSRLVMSDVPFCALALTAAWLADRSLRPEGRAAGVTGAALLMSAAVLTRTIGITLVIGSLATALYRRAYRQGALVALAAAPGVALSLWWTSRTADPAVALAASGLPGAGFEQTWLYYTSYGGFWKLSVPDRSVLWDLLQFHFWGWLQTPAALCLFPPPGGPSSRAGAPLAVCLSAFILAGVVRQARQFGWQPLHFAFPLYSALLIGWNYTLLDRSLLLFLPMFYAGLGTEIRHLSTVLRRDWKRGGWAARAPVAALGGAGLLALAAAAYHYAWAGRAPLGSQAEHRSALAADKAAFYDWVQRSTAADSRFVTYEDALLYLHTGRSAMWPLAFRPTASLPGQRALRAEDLARLPDVAHAIGARYWVATDDDYPFGPEREAYHRQVERILAGQPVVFRSAGGRVQVYDLAGWSEGASRIR